MPPSSNVEESRQYFVGLKYILYCSYSSKMQGGTLPFDVFPLNKLLKTMILIKPQT